MFYIGVVQVVLLYGSDTWVISPLVGKMLVGFHYRVVQRLNRRMPQKNLDSTWIYPSLDMFMTGALMHEVDTYVTRR